VPVENFETSFGQHAPWFRVPRGCVDVMRGRHPEASLKVPILFAAVFVFRQCLDLFNGAAAYFMRGSDRSMVRLLGALLSE